MIAIVLIAIAAGCASALMFASIISGALISLLLFYLAPLPLMVAAIGWGPLSAIIGGIGAAIGLGAIFGLPYCIAFVVRSRCRPGGSGISRCWGGRRPTASRRVTVLRRWRRIWNGIRSAVSCSGRRLCRIDHDAAFSPLAPTPTRSPARCGAACCASSVPAMLLRPARSSN